MRIVRFQSEHGRFWGMCEEDGIVPIIGDPFDSFRPDSIHYSYNDVLLLAPVLPSKIICVGKNYRDHLKELDTSAEPPDEPLLFFKPPSSLIGPGQSIVLPEVSERVDFEGELAVVISKTIRSMPAEMAHEAIFGLTCANDITARDLQKKDDQWTRAKGFDTFLPMGPWVVRDLDYKDLAIETFVNLEPRQKSSTQSMIFQIDKLISYISGIMTLYAGDVILTGTPAGVGPLKPGDQVEVRIEGIGALVNNVSVPE